MPASARSRGGQAETDGFDGLGLKTISGGWFPGFGHKTGADLARSRYASRRREVEEEPCPSNASTKIWTILPLCGRVV